MKPNTGVATQPNRGQRADDWLVGGGEMGEVVRAMDWAATPLGAIASWPQSLRTTVSLCLASNFPISLAWGPKHVQIYNDGYWPICGKKHPGSMGQDFSECWASAWPVIGDAFERALLGETSFLEDQRMFVDRNGYLEETFFTFSFSPIRDESGGVGGLFHPVTETTSRMLAERRTRALRDLAARAGKAQSVDEALTSAAYSLDACSLDLPFTLFYVLDQDGSGARLVASSGMAPGLPTSPVAVDLAGYDAVWPLSEVATTGQGEVVSDLRMRFGCVTCDPYPEPLHIALALPVTPPGHERPLAILIAGVSPRSPLNDAYSAFYDLLAAGVTAAVANALAHEDERRRAEALAEIDLAKTAFFSNVSHEFRTPLTLMLGPLEDELAERDEPLPKARHERLATAHRNSLRLLKLVNSLLNFSRVEAGRVHAHFEPSDLAMETAELASVFRSAIEKAGLTFTVDCAPLPEPVFVDHDMWEKVVLNLISNALKHTFTGGIGVGLRWLNGAAELTVTDSGVGIPKAELPRLFERFHRVKETKSRTHEGTGIGLALVHQLVDMHGGIVHVESQEGVGSTFRVTVKGGSDHLPQERIATRVGRPSMPPQVPAFINESLSWLRSARSSSAPPPGDPTRPRVLVADDNADMRDYVRRLLAAQYDVVAVADGVSALAAALERPPDLVVTDVMMPGLDGFGLLRELRKNDATRAVPVLILSARAGEDASVEGLDAGADDYLVKPFSARDLLARVRTHLELARIRRDWASEVKAREASQAAEEALRSSEGRLRRVIDSAIIGMTIINLDDGTLTQANDAFLQMTGYSREEVLEGRVQIATITPPEWQAQDREAARRLRTTGVLPLREKEYIHKSGRRVPVLVGGAMLEGSECVGFAADISDRKEAEVSARSELAARERAERALREKEEQLRQAQKMEAVGRLAGGVAHDFNNILSVVLSYAEMIVVEGDPTERVREDIEEIRKAGMRGADLTRQLLMFSRQQVLEPRLLDLNQLLAGMEKMLARLVGEDVELVCVSAPLRATVRADPGSIEQVIMNLVVNARDAMPIGGLLTIETRDVILDDAYAGEHLGVTPGRYVLLAVTDSGTGMDKATQARIFEPFFTTKEKGKGTGLGLSTVFGIVQQSDGNIQVRSELGRGTTFEAYFPLIDAEVDEVRPFAPRSTSRGTETILLVEDEEQVRTVASQILRQLGYHVIEASSGIDALRLTEEHASNIDLLLSDVVMPHMSGPELARRLIAARPAVKTLFMSGYTGDAMDRHGALDSPLAFVQKPFTPETLERKVRDALESRERNVDHHIRGP